MIICVAYPARPLLTILKKLGLIAMSIAALQPAFADSTNNEFDYSEVKKGAEEVAFFDICPNPVLRELAGIEADDCKSFLDKLAPICWHIIDPVVGDFRISRDDDGKKRFFQFAAVYSACIRSEILRTIIRERRRESGPDQSG
mgnify:CR=1 FL=1